MSWSGIILVLVLVLVLVVVGVLLLGNNFGMLPLGWLQQWWPALLIALGLLSILRPQHGRRRSKDDVALDRARRDADGPP
jgi:hypothetical protein